MLHRGEVMPLFPQETKFVVHPKLMKIRFHWGRPEDHGYRHEK